MRSEEIEACSSVEISELWRWNCVGVENILSESSLSKSNNNNIFSLILGSLFQLDLHTRV